MVGHPKVKSLKKKLRYQLRKKQFGKEVTHAFFDEVVTTHDEQAYQKFRRQIDELLDELSEYATTEAEIIRLTSNQPDEGYILAPSLMGDFKQRGEIRY